MTYGTKVYRQQGGSEFTVASGGSLNFEVGGKLGGTISHGAGSEIYESGALATFQAGASLRINAGPSATVLTFVTGTSVPSLYAGFDVPTFVAHPGSVYIRSQGSISGLYTNISQDAGVGGSSWRAFQQGSAIG